MEELEGIIGIQEIRSHVKGILEVDDTFYFFQALRVPRYPETAADNGASHRLPFHPGA